jgi:hypothetical protein
MRFTSDQQSTIRWRDGELGRLTPNVMDEAQALFTELVACNSDIGIALMYREVCVTESFA